jgi:hypothetical protein
MIDIHVFYSATKGVSNYALLDVLLAKAKISQFDVAMGVKQNIFWLEISAKTKKQSAVLYLVFFLIKPVYDSLDVQMLQSQNNFREVKTRI